MLSECGRHEDAQVQHTILLRADQFLTIEQEHRFVAMIEDLELRHSACLTCLPDLHRSERERFIENRVVGRARFIRD